MKNSWDKRIGLKVHPSIERIREEFDYLDSGELRRKSTNRVSKSTPGKYSTLTVDRVSFQKHRLIWIWHYGDIKEDHVIDHNDRDKGNAKIENLSSVTVSENSRNCNSSGKNSTGITGVVFNKFSKRYYASGPNPIGMLGKEPSGVFGDFDEAVCFRYMVEQCAGGYSDTPAEMYVKTNIQLELLIFSKRRKNESKN